MPFSVESENGLTAHRTQTDDRLHPKATLPMPSTLTREQEHWNKLVGDPALRDLPYKVETNAQGQIILSPHKARHSRYQKAVMKRLDDLLPAGEAFPEYPIVTPDGVKQPDVIWASQDRQGAMEETGDPPTLAPEICVEVLSESNTSEEMAGKRTLYREAGAREVWIVEEEGRVRFFGEDEQEESRIAPDFPTRVY